MDKLESIHILKQLANGVDPYTGEILPEQSPYQHPQTVRALFHAVLAIEKNKEGNSGTRTLTARLANAGQAWTREEDEQLIQEFDSGIPIKELAKIHQRTGGAIEARLARLGKWTNPHALRPIPITPDRHK